MTTGMLAPQWVNSAVFQTWSAGLTIDVPTIYPGMRVETGGWPEWFELWVDQWSPRVVRSHSPEVCDLRVTVHAYVRPTLEKARVSELVRMAAEIFNRQTISILDPETSDGRLGFIRLGEAHVKELTRLDAGTGRHGMQHHMATWKGIAQQLQQS